MDTQIKRGTKVQNQEGKTLTILEIVGGLMVRTYEEFNSPYHATKLLYNGKNLAKYL